MDIKDIKDLKVACLTLGHMNPGRRGIFLNIISYHKHSCSTCAHLGTSVSMKVGREQVEKGDEGEDDGSYGSAAIFLNVCLENLRFVSFGNADMV
jgi:hypothetical protein